MKKEVKIYLILFLAVFLISSVTAFSISDLTNFFKKPKLSPEDCSSKTQDCGKWRILSNPYWTEPLTQYQYDIFNMFFHFNMEPKKDGSLAYGGIGDSESAKNFIEKAHKNNDLAILVVGGWGYGPDFKEATNDKNRAKFVKQIMDRVHSLGYDGISFDWEENVNNENLVKTIKELRVEFDKLSPIPILGIDVCCEVTIDSIKKVEPYVDSINTMDYETTVDSYFKELTSAGIPASKIINGLGFYAYINSESRAKSEIEYVIDNNMQGIEIWDSSNIKSSEDSRLKPIKELLGNKPACIPEKNKQCTANEKNEEETIYDLLNQIEGFAKVAGTNGGKDGKIYHVTNLNDKGDGSLRKAVESTEKLWIVFDVSGKINLKNELLVKSHKTIDGRGQKIIISKPMRLYSKEDYGYASENVIIENIIFENTEKDSITIKYRGKNVWIDNSEFYDSENGEHDGLIDITRGSTDITISNSKFSKHTKTILIGHDDSNGKEDKNIRVTMYNNFFDGTGQRHPRLRFGKVHAFNNYFYKWKRGSDGKAFGMGSASNGEIYSEKNIFEADKDKDAIVTSGDDLGSSPPGKAKSSEDLFLNGAKAKTRGSDDVFNPSDYYKYSAKKADNNLKQSIKKEAGWKNMELPSLTAIKEKNESKNICNSNGICEESETPANCQNDCQCNINEDCKDNNLCATKICQNNKCIITNNSNSCDDNNACTINDVCFEGKCNGKVKDCDDDTACTADSCQNGICIHSSANCQCIADFDCEDANICTDNFCINNSCISSPNVLDCDDYDKTTANDKCLDNQCSGKSMRPKNTKFKNSISTKTEEIAELSNVKNFRLGIPNIAVIKFSKMVNLSGTDLDQIEIENATVSINSKDLPTLNVSAEIIFYNIQFKNPIIMKDGEICEECKVITKTDSTITISVPHFTEYEIVEGPYCGDQSCQLTENCTSCNADCGSCPNPIIKKCVSNWKCETWSECDETEIQTRTCTDLNSCSNVTNQKDEEKSCTYLDDEQNDETPTAKSEINWTLISLILAGIVLLLILFLATTGSSILEKIMGIFERKE